MRYASVCSGVEAASLAWEYIGWTPVAFSEIEPFPCAVLAARWPNVPNLGDMTKINVKDNGDIEYGTTGILANDGRPIDLIVGGTPCQDVSVAGKRAGIVEGERSKLAFTFTRLAYQLAAYRGLRWTVWENVPGVLSDSKGWGFAAFLSSLAGWDVAVPERGWGNFGIIRPATSGNFGLCWRILDVQYARVDGFPRAIPQRRRRVFLVGHLGSWERAAEVLFEPTSETGDTPPSRKQRQGASRDIEKGSDGLLRQDTCATLDASYYKGVGERNGNNRQLVVSNEGVRVCPTLEANLFNKNTFQDCGKFIIEKKADEQAVCFKGNGNETGDKSCTITGDHTDRVTDFTSIICVHGSQDPICNSDHANAVNRNNGLENCICFNGSSFGGRVAENVSGPVTTNESAIRGDTKIVLAANDGDKINKKERKGGSGLGIHEEDVSYTCTAKDVHGVVTIGADLYNQSLTGNVAMTVGAAASDADHIPCAVEKAATYSVRRLLPIECERLMGFPDNWTRISWRGKPAEECPDAPRYKACGNSMGVNCMRWIGLGIEAVENKEKFE